VVAAGRALEPVDVAAQRLQTAFHGGGVLVAADHGDDPAREDAADPATDLIAACGALIVWHEGAPAPRGYTRAEAELRSAGAVFRNAAFAFRGLVEAEPDQRAARADACEAMLTQGQHHVAAFHRLTR
jgi:hypothetical protein